VFLESAFKKKPDVDSKPLVVKTKIKAKELLQRVENVGQPA
jgi:hypothetical protein